MRTTLITFAACLLLAATATATATTTASTKLTASPNPVHIGQTLTARGRHWPVIEFCKRTVHFRLTSTQNAFSIGSVHVKTNGRFTFTYKVRKAKVGAGKWTLRAKMNCESGQDGSPNPVRRSVPLTIQA